MPQIVSQDSTVEVVTGVVTPEDGMRAQAYQLLAHFFSAPPNQFDLDAGAKLTGDDSELGRAISVFVKLCSKSTPEAVAEEYQDLFIGIGRGELVPYGSYYQTGFLHEKPLAKLRQDMKRHGLERDGAAVEPEDHIASVLEMMGGFIDGQYGTPLSLQEQKAFFETHVQCWAGHFFRDLEVAKTSVFYAALGGVGTAFMAIEEAAFDMV